jgi:hypothetical protein
MNVGAAAVNSWQVFASQELILAANMKGSVTKVMAKAVADLVVVTEAEALAASAKDPKDMSDAELTTATKFIDVAKPEQLAVRSNTKGKGTFLGGLTPTWDLLVAEARPTCAATVAAASTALGEAEAAKAAALINSQQPDPPRLFRGREARQ